MKRFAPIDDITLRPVRINNRSYVEWSCQHPFTSKTLEAWYYFKLKHALGKDAVGYYFDDADAVIKAFQLMKRGISGATP